MVCSPNLWSTYVESHMPAGLKEEEVVVAKAEKDPTHEAFLAPKKKKTTSKRSCGL